MSQTNCLYLVYIFAFISFVFANTIEKATCNGNTIISLPMANNRHIATATSAGIHIKLTNIPNGDITYDQGFTFKASAVDPQSKYVFILIQRLSNALLPQTLIKIHQYDILRRTDTASIEGEIVDELGIIFSAITFECTATEKSRLIGVRRHSSSETSTEIYRINYQHPPGGEIQINGPRTVIGQDSMDVLTYNSYQQYFMHISSDMNQNKWLSTYSMLEDEIMENYIITNVVISDPSNLCHGFITSIEPISRDLYYIACIDSNDIPQIYILDTTVPTMPEIKDLLQEPSAFPAGYSITGLITTMRHDGRDAICIGECGDIDDGVDEESSNSNNGDGDDDDNDVFNAIVYGANVGDRKYVRHSDGNWYSNLDTKLINLNHMVLGICGVIGIMCIACIVCCVCFKRKSITKKKEPTEDPTEDPMEYSMEYPTEYPSEDPTDDTTNDSVYDLTDDSISDSTEDECIEDDNDLVPVPVPMSVLSYRV